MTQNKKTEYLRWKNALQLTDTQKHAKTAAECISYGIYPSARDRTLPDPALS